MKAEAKQNRDPAIEPLLDVLLLYDHYAAALSAKLALDMLAGSLLGNACLRLHLWKLDLLRDPYLREVAAAQAASVKIILLSLHEDRELDPDTREWLRRWRAYRTDSPCALGLLIASPLAARASLRTHVAQAAREAGADFFQGFPTMPGNGTSPHESRGTGQETVFSEELQRKLRRVAPPSHWGLNE